ncbi:ATP-dependent DNA helicase RecG [Haloglycomyces albus]|uniref:ATP-dependent DNA helicase RecG n=1 Tax=Haloglycomyces albus TaxID=526067 RepID=UPI00046CF77F|nr:ATP-dependent DNA helicase RecG [Haloglycomyces albus]
MDVTFDSPLRDILGARSANALYQGLEMETVGDLLGHYPFRYFQRGDHTDLTGLVIGEQVTVLAQVKAVMRKQMRPKNSGSGARSGRRGSILEVVVSDSHGNTLTLTFFNQPWRAKELEIGKWGLFAGEVSSFRGRLQLAAPEAHMLKDPDDTTEVDEFAGALIPVYSTTAKVPTWIIGNSVRIALDRTTFPADPLPTDVRSERRLADLPTAIRGIHRPRSFADVGYAKKRLKWQEAFILETALLQRKHQDDSQTRTRPPVERGLLEKFDSQLPFTLTAGQSDIGTAVSHDLGSTRPMHRLLQGDVGSGKTLVALRAMLQVADSGGQSALLAPTEVLAAQHYRSLQEMLREQIESGDITITLITGSTGAAERREAENAVADGSAAIVIGTHALIYDGVDFHDLGLVVVDEQHRFGVEQRDALRSKSDDPPHTLVMTATPIPRTVAMTVYGDLDTSRLTELPAGRSPISTHVVPESDPRWVGRMWERMVEEVRQGRQGYVVCPRVGDRAESDPEDEDDPNAPSSVVDTFEELRHGPLSSLRLGLLHGRLDPVEKSRVMRTFEAGEIDVLVATTVIEVGVNVPNATMMVIRDADRFGISQLHQLRGRVGRGKHAGLCLLATGSPADSAARDRLSAVASTTDGFELAELDLRQRHEGDVLGQSQSGKKSHVKLLSLMRDTDIIEQSRAAADKLVSADPHLDSAPTLAAAVRRLSVQRGEYLQKG